MEKKVGKRRRRTTAGECECQMTNGQLKARLDAIVMLLAGLRFPDENGIFRQKPAAKLLHAAGLTPTEIARLFGKTSATDVSKYLY